MARLILSLLFTFSLSIGLYSQVVLHAPSLAYDANKEFNFDITIVDGFDSIGLIGFNLKWDPAVIEFVDTLSLGLTPNFFNQNPFNFDKVAEGLLPFLWIASSQDLTLEDGSLLMSLKFKTVGVTGSSTEVIFVSSENLPVEAKSAGVLMPITVDTGFVQINVVSTETVEELSSFSATPNPSSEDVLIELNLSSPIDLNWFLTDISGRKIISNKIYNAFGHHTITLNRDLFLVEGVYLFSVKSARGVLTQKLIIH